VASEPEEESVDTVRDSESAVESKPETVTAVSADSFEVDVNEPVPFNAVASVADHEQNRENLQPEQRDDIPFEEPEPAAGIEEQSEFKMDFGEVTVSKSTAESEEPAADEVALDKERRDKEFRPENQMDFTDASVADAGDSQIDDNREFVSEVAAEPSDGLTQTEIAPITQKVYESTASADGPVVEIINRPEVPSWTIDAVLRRAWKLGGQE
jgi:hypothetical protein